jgi:hypothetical protein
MNETTQPIDNFASSPQSFDLMIEVLTNLKSGTPISELGNVVNIPEELRASFKEDLRSLEGADVNIVLTEFEAIHHRQCLRMKIDCYQFVLDGLNHGDPVPVIFLELNDSHKYPQVIIDEVRSRVSEFIDPKKVVLDEDISSSVAEITKIHNILKEDMQALDNPELSEAFLQHDACAEVHSFSGVVTGQGSFVQLGDGSKTLTRDERMLAIKEYFERTHMYELRRVHAGRFIKEKGGWEYTDLVTYRRVSFDCETGKSLAIPVEAIVYRNNSFDVDGKNAMWLPWWNLSCAKLIELQVRGPDLEPIDTEEFNTIEKAYFDRINAESPDEPKFIILEDMIFETGYSTKIKYDDWCVRSNNVCTFKYHSQLDNQDIVTTHGFNDILVMISSLMKIRSDGIEMGRHPIITKKQMESWSMFQIMNHVYRIDSISDERVSGTLISGTMPVVEDKEDLDMLMTVGDNYFKVSHFIDKNTAVRINNAIYYNGECVVDDFRGAFSMLINRILFYLNENDISQRLIEEFFRSIADVSNMAHVLQLAFPELERYEDDSGSAWTNGTKSDDLEFLLIVTDSDLDNKDPVSKIDIKDYLTIASEHNDTVDRMQRLVAEAKVLAEKLPKRMSSMRVFINRINVPGVPG